ncbi:hypothetical protein [Paenibacillus sinopodophylli]|uniref:hypothetical protein n=1 Tax=Paenibacillus sinopodophylli TaxID=1837342 RepID=UPI00110CE974|nr:hypothetical protein [Paenibacillus sinopodophylli]
MLPNGTTLSVKRGAQGWKVRPEDVQILYRDTQKELSGDPDVKALYQSGKHDEVWDILSKRIVDKMGGEYIAIRK